VTPRANSPTSQLLVAALRLAPPAPAMTVVTTERTAPTSQHWLAIARWHVRADDARPYAEDSAARSPREGA
jgi:hypothetical protein